MTSELKLPGCTPTPLAGYLKALGVLRIVSEQVDATTKGWWEKEQFVVESPLERSPLIEFFANDYVPTPIVGPWGARSGFYAGSSEKAARAALTTIASSATERLALFREGITATRNVLDKYRVSEKPEKGAPNDRLMLRLRAELPDDLLPWLDSVYVLLSDSSSFPPLLGTGGNEGSGSYTSGFAQAVVEAIVCRKFDSSLAPCLFSTVAPDEVSNLTPGHFAPGASGGANAGTGFEGRTSLNTWSYILMLEGAIAFAGTCVRKLETSNSGALAYPFCVRAAGGGYGSADLSDEGLSRSEMWMPLWSAPSTFQSVSHLLSEGRVNIGRRQARNGVDFARAVASVGVDRGIDSFQRFGFQQRNGLSYFAVPLGRFDVKKPSTVVSLLNRLDSWLDRFRRAVTGQHAPARAASALRNLESAIFEACQQPSASLTQRLLIALGEAESAIATSSSLREADYPVPPVPLLPPEWIATAYPDDQAIGLDETADARSFRLAASLASLGFFSGLRVNNQPRIDPVGPFRRHVEPINPETLRNRKNRRARWAEHANDPSLVWAGGSLVQNLNRLLNRRMIDAIRLSDNNLHAPFDGKCPALLPDVFRFIEGDVDDRLMDSLVRGLMLIDWSKVKRDDIPWRRNVQPMSQSDAFPSAAWCLLRLCLLPHPIPLGDTEVEIKLTPQIARRASIGDLTEATRLAARRLRASGLKPAVDQVFCADRRTATRTSAALVFPISHSARTVRLIRDRVMFRESASQDFDNEAAKEETATGFRTGNP